MYVKVENNQATKYSLERLFRENPNVSFPKTPSDATLAEYGVYPLVDGTKPDFDNISKGPIEQINGVWTQTYTGRNSTDGEKRAGMIVSARQARLALNAAGLLAQVQTAIDAMAEQDKTIISLEWEYATQIDRTSSWVATMGVALDLTEAELDDLFVAAADL